MSDPFQYTPDLNRDGCKTLVDEFAMAALTTIDRHWPEETMATRAYEIAHAMMEARKVKP